MMIGRMVRRPNGAGEPRHAPVNTAPPHSTSRSSTIRAARAQTSREATNVSNRDLCRLKNTKQVCSTLNSLIFIILGHESKALHNVSSNTFL